MIERPSRRKAPKGQDARSSPWVICFSGSYGDGTDVDLVSWVGLELSDREHDALWGTINEIDLIERTASGYIDIGETIDEVPGLSDVDYTVVTRDEAKFRKELRDEILMIVGRTALPKSARRKAR